MKKTACLLLTFCLLSTCAGALAEWSKGAHPALGQGDLGGVRAALIDYALKNGLDPVEYADLVIQKGPVEGKPKPDPIGDALAQYGFTREDVFYITKPTSLHMIREGVPYEYNGCYYIYTDINGKGAPALFAPSDRWDQYIGWGFIQRIYP